VTENGAVFLMGRVTQHEADTATEAVREVSGVQKVVKVFEYIDSTNVMQESDVRNQGVEK
jgi:osmotically-inducible protein OsmY